ncbi:MAG: DUF4190 domain-containing protein [Micromonosporaceae bacterium]
MTDPDQSWRDPNWQPSPPSPAPSADPTFGYTTPQPAYGYGAPGYAAPPTNSLAIASMIVAILGFGPIGAIMGHVARRQIKERGEQGDGFALAGIIVGWITTGIWVVCCGGMFVLWAAGMAVGGTGAV